MNTRLAPANKSCTQTTKFMLRSVASDRKPYCKVCHDAGKPESDYTSHYVRSRPDQKGNTTVTCPTLLNTECRYCYELGHTAKFCPVIAARNKDDERRRRQEERHTKETQKPVAQPKAQQNTYSVLFDNDSDEESKPVVEEFPALGAPSQRVITGYAAAAAKPVPIVESKAQTLPSGFTVLKKGATYEKTEPVKRILKFSWLDDDSDNEAEPYVDNSAWD